MSENPKLETRNSKPERSERIDYDRIAATYDQVRRFDLELPAQMLALGGIGPEARGGRILEIGCGTGNFTARLETLTPVPIVGLDLSRGMLARAAGKLQRTALVRADGLRLPLANSSFRMVLAAMMIHHVSDRPLLLAGCLRVLAPGGTLAVLSTSHEQIAAHFINRFFPSFAEVDRARFPDIPPLKRQLEDAGFLDVQSRPTVVARFRPDDAYLRKVRQKHMSTFHLIPKEEYERGLVRFEAYVRSHADPPEMRHHATVVWGQAPG